MITILLNILCDGGLTLVSWIIVFIPFILMTVIVSMLLYIFGLDAASGTLNYTCKNNSETEKTIIIKDPNPEISMKHGMSMFYNSIKNNNKHNTSKNSNKHNDSKKNKKYNTYKFPPNDEPTSPKYQS
jgi:hypothetical protein